VEVRRGGEIIVRAPLSTSAQRIEKFLADNRLSIERAVAKAKKQLPMYSSDSLLAEELKRKALSVIPPRVEYFAHLMNLEPRGVKITSAQKRFGSCSSKGNLCFSFNLAQYPDEIIDYVVVHELAHLKEFNHGADFWRLVEKYIPDYVRRRNYLKK
jgi:predicted metal-dependent hydrolase